MSDKTSGRLGWTGILVTEAATAAASTSSGPHTGVAAPADANTGTMTLRSCRVERADASTAAVEVEVSRGGQALGPVPAEVVGYLGTDATPYGWMSPNVSWGHEWVGTASLKTRLCRWGGPEGYTRDHVSSDALMITDYHDICPAENGKILAAYIADTDVVYVIHCRWYERVLSPTSQAASSSQVIDMLEIAPSTHDISRVRVAWRNGSALLIVQAAEIGVGGPDRIYQWASTDGGMSWEYVGSSEDTTADDPSGIADLEATPDGFVFAFASQADALATLRVGVVASPFTPIWAAPYTSVGGADVWDDSVAGRVTGVESSICCAETGEIYLIVLNYAVSGDHKGMAYRSSDGGQSWHWMLAGVGSVLAWLVVDVSTAERPSITDATWARGGVMWTGAVGTERWRMRLGGWSQYASTSPTWGGSAALRGEVGSLLISLDTVAWDDMYLPWDGTPTTCGWTYSVDGSPTETMTTEYLRLAGTAGSRSEQSYVLGGPETATTPFVLRARIRASTNITRTNDSSPIFAEFTGCNGTKTYAVRVCIGNDEVRVYQRTGGSTYSALAAAAAHSFAGGIAEWYVWVSFTPATDKANVYIRGRDGSDPIALAGKAWTFTSDVLNATVTDLYVTPVTATTVTWGSYLMTGEVADWYEVWLQTSPASAPAAPTVALVQGRPLSGPMVHVLPDVLVQSVGGLAHDEDSWTIATAHDGAAAHVTSPDPGLAWSSGTLTSETLTVTLATPIPGPLVGVVLRGLVSEAILVEVQNTAGSWSTVSASGANEIGGMNADRRSSTYTPRSGGASTPIWRENELAGCWLHFDDEVHPILDNRGGRWSSAATSAQPHIRTDSTEGITATNGAISIYPRDVMVLADIGIGSTMAAVRVTFAAATHGWPDGSAWGCTRVLPGGVVVLGDDPDWSRARRTSVPVSTVTLPSGRVRPRATLPARREVDVAWTDGVDTMAQAAEASAPDWIGVATGADPMGDVGSTPYTLEGLLSRIQGEAGEVVLVRVGVGDLTDGGTLLLRRRHEFLHGRITSVVSLDAAQGEEDTDQIFRVGTLTVREEV